jgi:hypothetical protein
MPLEMPEADWKRLRGFYKSGLERYCKRVLEEVERLNTGIPLSFHERYLDLYKLIESRDKELGLIFNDNLRRSRAVELALMLKRESLMSVDEFEQFSPQTQDLLNSLLNHRLL